MELYYVINEDNELLYSGQEFEGSTLSTSVTIPTTSEVVKVAPYDDNLVYWDLTEYPRAAVSCYCDLVDLSGIVLTVDTSMNGIYNNPYWSTIKYVFPRNVSEHLKGNVPTQANNFWGTRIQTVSCVEYGDGHLPDLPNVTALNGWFYECTQLRSLVVHSIDKVTNLADMFKGCTNLSNVVFANDWISVVRTTGMFNGCISLTSFYWPNCPKLTILGEAGSTGMFANSGLTSLTIPAMPNKLDILGLCSGCTDLVSVDIRAQINSLSGAFNGCSDLEIVNINSRSCPSFQGAFNGCIDLASITLDITNATNMDRAFYGCTHLVTVNLKGGSKVTHWAETFYNCSALTTIHCSNIVSHSDTNTFYGCVSLVGGNGTAYNAHNTGGVYAIVDGYNGSPGYFTYDIEASYDKLYVYTVDSAGSIETNFPGDNYKRGATVELTYKPNIGYTIDYWIKWNNTTHRFDKVSEDLTYRGTADGDMLFFAIPKVSAGSGASLTVSLSSYPSIYGYVVGSGVYEAGTDVLISARAYTGYRFVKWQELIDGEYIDYSTGANTSIREIGRNMTLRAVFEEYTPTPPTPVPDNPYEQQGSSTTGGATGQYDRQSDVINNDLYNTSLVQNAYDSTATIYVPTSEEFTNFFALLYGETTATRIANIASQIVSAGGKVTDYVLKCYILPYGLLTVSENEYKFNMGFYDNLADGQGGHWKSKVSLTRMVPIDLGEIDVEEYWGNALDYESEIQIYLPYVGYQKLDARNVMGKRLKLTYNVDLLTGDCVALISVNDSVLYQFSGNMAFDIPVSMENRTNQVLSNAGEAIRVAGLMAAL